MSDEAFTQPVTAPTTTKEGTSEVQNGSEALTFDELDALSDKTKSKRPEPKEEKKEAKGEKDLTSDDRKGKAEEKPKAKAKESDKPDIKETEEAPARKTIKAKYEDNELDLDEEANIPVKINDKIEMVPVKDLIANYSGKVGWDKKFTELDQTRKSVATQQMKVAGINEKLQSMFQEKDPKLRLYKISELAGVNPVQFREQFLNENMEMLERWSTMSEAERKAETLEWENHYLKYQSDTRSQHEKSQQAQKALAERVERLRASHEVSEDEYSNMHEQLKNAGHKEITPESIVERISKGKLWDAGAEELLNLKLGWSNKEVGDKLQRLVEEAYKIGLKPKDLPEVVSQLYGTARSQKKVQEKQEKAKEFTNGSKSVAQAQSRKDEPVFFDEI